MHMDWNFLHYYILPTGALCQIPDQLVFHIVSEDSLPSHEVYVAGLMPFSCFHFYLSPSTKESREEPLLTSVQHGQAKSHKVGGLGSRNAVLWLGHRCETHTPEYAEESGDDTVSQEVF